MEDSLVVDGLLALVHAMPMLVAAMILPWLSVLGVARLVMRRVPASFRITWPWSSRWIRRRVTALVVVGGEMSFRKGAPTTVVLR